MSILGKIGYVLLLSLLAWRLLLFLRQSPDFFTEENLSKSFLVLSYLVLFLVLIIGGIVFFLRRM